MPILVKIAPGNIELLKKKLKLNLYRFYNNAFFRTIILILIIMGIVQAIPSAINLGALIYNSIKEGQARKKEQEKQESVLQSESELSKYLLGESKKDVFDTDFARSTMAKLRDAVKKSNEIATSNAARTGATTESEIARKTTSQEKYNDALMTLAAAGQQRNDAMRTQYANSLGSIFTMNDKVYGDVADRWGLASVNAGNNLGTSMATMFGNKK